LVRGGWVVDDSAVFECSQSVEDPNGVKAEPEWFVKDIVKQTKAHDGEKGSLQTFGRVNVGVLVEKRGCAVVPRQGGRERDHGVAMGE
jgi:hypothetical protein